MAPGRFLLVGVALASMSAGALSAEPIDPAFAAAMASAQRTPKFVARDPVRHPAEELAFFGLAPASRVVEIWPGGGYWTEMLAPYLRDRGALTEALQGKRADGTAEAGAEARNATFRDKLARTPALYDKVQVTMLGAGETAVAPASSVDLIVTFRNLHNWMADGDVDEVLAGFFRALKPGGILGVEDHRGHRAGPQDPKAADGYIDQDYAIALARKAGFVFVGGSEINANPKDTADWPKGVWTLPPDFALGEQDRAKYAAIGEADNFVLKFRKPEP